MHDKTWPVLEGGVEQIRRRHADPMRALAGGEIGSIVVRGAMAAGACERIVQRLYERGLVDGLPRPGEAIAEKPKIERVDVGASLGNFGKEPAAFFAKAAEANALFATLFDGLTDPIRVLYDALAAVSPGKRVVTAREDDGRAFGPAIIRCHLPHWGYPPHVDSVRRRQKFTQYAVHRFPHQLAGLLLLQAPSKQTGARDSTIFNYSWTPQREQADGVTLGDPGAMDAGAFHDLVRRDGIASVDVSLNTGDLYFFNSENVHEVPGFTGHRPRIVLATFFGYDPDGPDIYVWS